MSSPRVERLGTTVRGAGLNVEVAGGGEVAETIVARLSGRGAAPRVPRRGGRWILLEPRPGPLSDSLTETVDALAARGFSSLIAHPERHPVEHRLGGRPLLEQRGVSCTSAPRRAACASGSTRSARTAVRRACGDAAQGSAVRSRAAQPVGGAPALNARFCTR